MIGDGTLFHNFARFVENADGVLLVPEIEANGDGKNFVFHDGSECITARKRRLLPSHLILFGGSDVIANRASLHDIISGMVYAIWSGSYYDYNCIWWVFRKKNSIWGIPRISSFEFS